MPLRRMARDGGPRDGGPRYGCPRDGWRRDGWHRCLAQTDVPEALSHDGWALGMSVYELLLKNTVWGIAVGQRQIDVFE